MRTGVENKEAILGITIFYIQANISSYTRCFCTESADVLATYCSLHLHEIPQKISDIFLLTSAEILKL